MKSTNTGTKHLTDQVEESPGHAPDSVLEVDSGADTARVSSADTQPEQAHGNSTDGVTMTEQLDIAPQLCRGYPRSLEEQDAARAA